MKEIPSSVYRLQINENFPLSKVITLLPYFENLGIDGIYCSPIFDAGSLHGYDVTNHNMIHPLIGTIEEFDTLCSELKKRNMKLVCDVVPNHMGIKEKKNLWWLDVLKYGPQSQYADFFDIDWNPLKRELHNKILLPVLADPYGQALLKQEIQLKWAEEQYWIHYKDYAFPVAEGTLNEPPTEQTLKKYNGIKNDDKSFEPLHELLEKQYYQLAHWLVATQEINYRRFFNINELIALHIENEKVFQEHHRLVLNWIDSKKVQGLRIDHPDGLYDPSQYFDRLQTHRPAFVVVEKILDRNESLPPHWDVQGTVGYEYLNCLNGLFIQKNHESQFTQIYETIIERRIDFEALLYDRKKWFITNFMGSEIHRMGYELDQIAEKSRYSRDFTRVDFINALKEVIACFPVYRSYIRKGEPITKRDLDYIAEAIEKAKLKTPEIHPAIYTYIKDFFTSDIPSAAPERIDFILRFQQQTGPIMAKGLEDSVFFIYNRFLSLNEVGSDPTHFGISPAEFHYFNEDKLKKYPLGFLPTSTQDTKWSEDARMRLNVLSELPGEWNRLVTEWTSSRIKIDLNMQYYIYQLLISIWPDDVKSPSEHLKNRIWEVCLKALRSSGMMTDWRHPNLEYEKALHDFLMDILESKTFLDSFLPFQRLISHFGKFNSLSSLILKIGSCGIVDFYQGNETWNYAMMDPDNRRPIDYEKMQKSLKWSIAQKGLQFRREHDELFLYGAYEPLKIQGVYKEKIIAFIRKNAHETIIIVAGRFFTDLQEPPLGISCWEDTKLILPKLGESTIWEDIFTESSVTASKEQNVLCLSISDLFHTYPFAILTPKKSKEKKT